MRGKKIDMDLVAKYQIAIEEEFVKATRRYGEFNSDHEGFAVLREEVDELWDSVKLKQTHPERNILMEKEAIQVGAMALRFLHDMRKRNDRI